ncbi:Putative acetyltransferase [Stieleria neptunia]|uniref:Acetyltransferase n=1 Tax=Stieleria neptunia TaxID=2527979 RepID=A0A518HQU0_9BACT|nr:acyltransferase [Stieleria neptunia]QDV43219.1 Putative acetyltransferase [Stieleria neptunia]
MTTLLKTTVQTIAIAIISPLLLTHLLLSVTSSADSSLETHSQFLSLIPGKLGSYLRVAFYRFALDHCDPTATICFGVLFSKTGARLHQNVYIGPRCMIGLATLDDDVLLGPAVQIPSGPQSHGISRLDVPIRDQSGTLQRISIGRDSWIGGGSFVLADVAEQCVVGAGSIVTKPTQPQTISVGNPARPVGKRGEPSTVSASDTAGATATQVDEVRADGTLVS